MDFWVEKNTTLNKATNPDALVDRVPGMRDSLAAVADLREQYRQDGTQGALYNGGWKHVASVHGPVLAVAEILDQEFLNRNGKKDFYKWLDDNKSYCAYDRRKQAKRSDLVTFVNGKEV